jgi:DNA gyrase/topoisomerase IV subunit A
VTVLGCSVRFAPTPRSQRYRPRERVWIKTENRDYWRYGEELESLRRSLVCSQALGQLSGESERRSEMPEQGDVHVVSGDKGWLVEVEGSGAKRRARSTHRTQAAAWKEAKKVARGSKSEALLHGRDGKIRERNTYGHDPRRAKG